jgi:two-component system LytT family sensor kinase
MNTFFTPYINAILQKRWLTHVIFWVLLLLCYTIAMYNGYDTWYKSFNRNLILLIPQILASYFIIYYLNPKYLYQKKYIRFTLLFVIGTYVFSILARVLLVHIVEELYREPPFRKESFYEIATDIKRLYKDFFYRVYLPVFLVVCIKLIKERFEEKNRQEVLQKEKVIAELNFMKAQIHPHFLFNTLNNLYVLTLQKSEKASETVLKLSEMLDYMMYKCNSKRVTIAEEVQLIQNYINLEQLRYGDRLAVVFNQNIDSFQTQIAPLILVSLIENAFKHGASGSISTPKIAIEFKVNNNELQFSIYNTKPAEAQEDETNFKKGIGLGNIKNQLSLIYPEKHVFEIKETKESYLVNLNIQLL